MLRQALFRALVVLGAAAALAYPLLDLLTGRGPQVTWLVNGYLSLIFYVVGAFLYFKRPEHPVARRLLLAGTCSIVGATIGQLVSVAQVTSGPQRWFWLAFALGAAAQTGFLVGLLTVFAVFPDGRYQRGYERWTVRAVATLPVLIPVLQLLSLSKLPVNPFYFWAAPTISSPLYTPSLGVLGGLAGILSGGQLTLVAIAAGLLIARYRRLDAEERLQARWPLFSLFFVIPFGMGPVGYLVSLTGVWVGPHNTALALFVLPTLPLSVAIGVMRPHLLDLELVIRKSVVYAALWLLIALGYVAMAAGVGVAAAQRNEVGVVVLVTILATVAFQPIRSAVERFASRLVYGERLTGYQAVSRLGVSLEEAAHPEQAAYLLAATVRQALDARWARVVIEGANPSQATDGSGDRSAAGAMLTAPLVYGEEVVGRVECGPRSEGHYRQRDEELLFTLTRHAALAIRNAALATELADRLEQINLQAQELQASRSRIVQAEEAGRRRLERDIHDGVQQELVALLAKIGRARSQLGRGSSAVAGLLAELQEETKLTLSDLRDLAQGIHPTVLTDRGLVEAIQDRISRLPDSVSLEADARLRNTRFPQAVEGAAYFTVCEGLANAMKHASAERVVVRLGAEGDGLMVEVSDDGAGFLVGGVARSGLSGLQDRIDALGGKLAIVTAPGRGTQLRATLPARAATVV
jgi:signal transduction histidine kinase